jgi:hypothetical protein
VYIVLQAIIENDTAVNEHAPRAGFPFARHVPFANFKNRFPGGTCYVVGRGPTTFDYQKLAEISQPVFFINDAVCLEKYTRSETFFFAHDIEMRVWLNGSMKSTAVLPSNGTILDGEPEAVLGHTGPVVLYHRQDEDREELMRMNRDQLADAAALFGHSGTIHSLLHFVWFCGLRQIIYIGCDGINQKHLLANNCGSKDGYDPRLLNRSHTAPGWHYIQIKRVQDLLTGLLGISTSHLGSPIQTPSF